MAGKKGQLGGLFVELGFKGQPLLKGLDVAAGKFSLIKHAATEASKMIDNAISGVASKAADLNKISVMTGFTPTQLRQWREWEHINKVTEGTVARTYANIQEMQAKFNLYKSMSALPRGYQMAQISPFQSPENIVKQFQQYAKKMGLSAPEQTSLLSEMGISPEFVALLNGVQSQVDSNTRATDKETKALVELDNSVATLKDTMDNVYERFSGKMAPALTNLNTLATRLLELPFLKDPEQKAKKKAEIAERRNVVGLDALNSVHFFTDKVLNKIEQKNPWLKKSTFWGQVRFYNAPSSNASILNNKPSGANGLEPITDMKDSGGFNSGLPPEPSPASGNTINSGNSITNNVNVTVNGADIDKNNLQYTLLNEINNAANLNAISDYAQRNRDDL